MKVWANLPNFQTTRNQISKEIAMEPRWLHPERLSAAYREEIRRKVLKWLFTRHGKDAQVEDVNMTMHQIFLKHPAFVMKLLDDEK